jgi:methionyl aminopeptidase
MQSDAIGLKSTEEIEGMRASASILVGALRALIPKVEPGVTTDELAQTAHDYIHDHGGVPSFLGVPAASPNTPDFPASICASVNDVIVHGIPSGARLTEGDIIGIDCGVVLDGWHSDSAVTLPVGEVSDEAERLIAVTNKALDAAVKAARPGKHVGDLGAAVQRVVESAEFSVVRRFVGHGIGRSMHEPPQVPNFGEPGGGAEFVPGMTLAIEPMVNIGTHQVRFDGDGWTARTADGRLSAHSEHTIAITENEPLVLTRR